MTTTTTTTKPRRYSEKEKADLIVKALTKGGPQSMKELRATAGFTVNQVKAGWHTVKQKMAADGPYVAVCYKNIYGLWDDCEEAWLGTLNRMDDSVTRLLTIEAGSFAAMVALGMVTPRMARGVEMIRQEYEEMVEKVRVLSTI